MLKLLITWKVCFIYYIFSPIWMLALISSGEIKKNTPDRYLVFKVHCFNIYIHLYLHKTNKYTNVYFDIQQWVQFYTKQWVKYLLGLSFSFIIGFVDRRKCSMARVTVSLFLIVYFSQVIIGAGRNLVYAKLFVILLSFVLLSSNIAYWLA